MSTVNRSSSLHSIHELQETQEVSRRAEQPRNQTATPSVSRQAAALEDDLIELRDPGHLLDTLHGSDTLRHERTVRVFTGLAAGLGALGTAIGLAPASMNVAHSCYGKPSPEKDFACSTAKASVVGAAFGVLGVIMTVAGWKLGATHYSGEVRDIDRKLSNRYARMLQARVDSGEQFPSGRPDASNIVSRYMKLNVGDRNHVREALETNEIQAAIVGVTVSVNAENV